MMIGLNVKTVISLVIEVIRLKAKENLEKNQGEILKMNLEEIEKTLDAEEETEADEINLKTESF